MLVYDELLRICNAGDELYGSAYRSMLSSGLFDAGASMQERSAMPESRRGADRPWFFYHYPQINLHRSCLLEEVRRAEQNAQEQSRTSDPPEEA